MLIFWTSEVVGFSFLSVDVVFSGWRGHIEILFVENFSRTWNHSFDSVCQLLLSWSFSLVGLLGNRRMRDQHSHFFALFAFSFRLLNVFELFLAFTFIQFLMKIVIILIGLHWLLIILLILVIGHFHELGLWAWTCLHGSSMNIEALGYFVVIWLLIFLTSFLFLKLVPYSQNRVDISFRFSFRIFDGHHWRFGSYYRLFLSFLNIINRWPALDFLLVFRRLVWLSFSFFTFLTFLKSLFDKLIQDLD